MKKINLVKKLIAVIMVLVYLGMSACIVKPKSYCQKNCQKKIKENYLTPKEKNSSDVFPSKDFIIKI